VRWVHAGQVIVLYLLENGQEIATLPVTEGKAKVCVPPGIGLIVRESGKIEAAASGSNAPAA
jgi:hypothetical protein